MTKADEVFEDLKAGIDYKILEKRYSSGTLSRGTQRYFKWAPDEIKKVRGSLNRLEKKEKNLQEVVEKLDKDERNQKRSLEALKKQTLALKKDDQETRDNIAESEKRLDSLENSLNELIQAGVSKDAIARINSIDFGDGDELLKRIATLENYINFQSELTNIEIKLSEYNTHIEKIVAELDDLIGKVGSKENELDEAKRRHYIFEESIELLNEFQKSGYHKDTLLSFKEALKRIEIQGRPEASLGRLFRGLRNYKNLNELDSTLRTRRQELDEIKKELEKSRGSLSAFQENILKELKETEKEFTKNIKSMYKEYVKGLEKQQKDYEVKAKILFDLQENQLAEFSLAAKKTLAAVGLAHSSEMSKFGPGLRDEANRLGRENARERKEE